MPYLQFCNAVHQRCPLLIIICFAGLQGTPGGTARSSCGTTTPGTHLYCPPHCCAATLWGQAPPRWPQAALQACWTPPCRPSTDRRCRRSGGRGRSRSQSPPLKSLTGMHACAPGEAHTQKPNTQSCVGCSQADCLPHGSTGRSTATHPPTNPTSTLFLCALVPGLRPASVVPCLFIPHLSYHCLLRPGETAKLTVCPLGQLCEC